MDRDITLRIVLESPPAGVDFGIQKGRGSMVPNHTDTAVNRRRPGVRVRCRSEDGDGRWLTRLWRPDCARSARRTVRLRRHRHARRTARHAVEPAVEGSTYRFPGRPDATGFSRGNRRIRNACARNGEGRRPVMRQRQGFRGVDTFLRACRIVDCCQCREARRASHRITAEHTSKVRESPPEIAGAAPRSHHVDFAVSVACHGQP